MMFGVIPKCLDEEKYVATRRLQSLSGLEVLKPENLFTNPEKISRGVHILQTWDPSIIIKLTAAFPLVISVLQSLGTEVHQDLIQQVLNGEVMIVIKIDFDTFA